MSAQTSPISSLLRDAWNVIRLDVIRETVEHAICELQALDLDAAAKRLRRPELRRDAGAAMGTRGAAQAALEACCDELRDGCGLPVVGVQPLPPMGSEWLARYRSALEVYRDAAMGVLSASFGQPPRPPARRPSSVRA